MTPAARWWKDCTGPITSVCFSLPFQCLMTSFWMQEYMSKWVKLKEWTLNTQTTLPTPLQPSCIPQYRPYAEAWCTLPLFPCLTLFPQMSFWLRQILVSPHQKAKSSTDVHSLWASLDSIRVPMAHRSGPTGTTPALVYIDRILHAMYFLSVP